MNGEFGLTGYCHIKIEKADGRVLTQGKKNRLDQGVATNLGSKIASNSYTYSSSFVPKKLQIYVRGYGDDGNGNELTMWKSNVLTAVMSEEDTITTPVTAVLATYKDLVFDGGDNFTTAGGGSDGIFADGETSEIYAVRLLDNDGTEVIGQALYGDTLSGYDFDKFGFGSLKGEVGAGTDDAYIIDNNDKITITYKIYFSVNSLGTVAETGNLLEDPQGDDLASLYNYMGDLRDTVAGTATPDISLKSASVYYAGEEVEESKTVITLDTDNFSLTTNPLLIPFTGVANQPRGKGTWIYFGDPTINDYTNPGADPDVKAISGSTVDVTDKAEFAAIPAADRPTRVTLYSGAGRVIYSFGINAVDISTWTSGDSIEFSFYMLVSVNMPILYNLAGAVVDVDAQENSPSDPMTMSPA